MRFIKKNSGEIEKCVICNKPFKAETPLCGGWGEGMCAVEVNPSVKCPYHIYKGNEPTHFHEVGACRECIGNIEFLVNLGIGVMNSMGIINGEDLL